MVGLSDGRMKSSDDDGGRVEGTGGERRRDGGRDAICMVSKDRAATEGKVGEAVRTTTDIDAGEKGNQHGDEKQNHAEQQQQQQSPPRWKKVLTMLAGQWFLIALGILIAFASQVQVPLGQQEVKRTVTSYLCISIIFFITGSTLPSSTLLTNYRRWPLTLYTQTSSFLLTSSLVFGLVSAIATNRSFLSPGLLIGLIFFSCVPTTISSNVVMTRQAHGNTALTVVQTTVGNLLGVFVSPALVVMYTGVGAWYEGVLPREGARGMAWGALYGRVLMQLGLSIYLPLVVGQVARHFFPRKCETVFVEWQGGKLGSVCLLVLLWATYDQAFATRSFSRVPGDNMVFIVFISVVLWVVFFAVTLATSVVWLPREDVVSLCMCVPAKGIVMGVPLSTTIFAGMGLKEQSEVQIPIVVYQGLQLVFASLLVPIFRGWVDRRKREEGGEEGLGGREVVESGVIVAATSP